MKKPLLAIAVAALTSVISFAILSHRKTPNPSTKQTTTLPATSPIVAPSASTSSTTPAASTLPQPQPLEPIKLVIAEPIPKANADQPRAKPKFDPRFEQPATRDKLFGPDDDEILASAARSKKQAEDTEARAVAWAKANGHPVSGVDTNGSQFYIIDVKNGEPVYRSSELSNARISHNITSLNQFDTLNPVYNLTGFGWTVGMWDGGAPRLDHLDFSYLNDLSTRRVTYVDGTDASIIAQGATNPNLFDDHSTHVLGIMIGNGYGNNTARGMAPLATASAYDGVADFSEMTIAGALRPNQPNKLYVSNHSYGWPSGWEWSQFNQRWEHTNGLGNATGHSGYSAYVRSFDQACYNRPYLLPFKSAGNERGESPSAGANVAWNNGLQTGTFGVTPGVPGIDGGATGYDTLSEPGAAKNVMTVGNMNDAVIGGVRVTFGISLAPSSSFGPADDGRIKPDIVANGVSVNAPVRDSTTSYGEKTGTSMASPGAAGTAILLHEHYKNRTGQFMRASTTKALIIHTATDVLATGPDYMSGWGLIDGAKAVEHIEKHATDPGTFHILEDHLSNERSSISLTFEATSAPKATLVWTDPAGSATTVQNNRTRTLVNDLNITLIAPDGTSYLAPQLSFANPAAPATYTGNNVDTVEVIGANGQAIPFIPGTYQLEISYTGALTQPDANGNPVPDPIQVFSLMLEGHDPDTIGTLSAALDNDFLAFNNNTNATAGFAYQYNILGNDFDRAVNFDIDDNESAAFETTVQGPTTIIFRWGVSSEIGYDFMRFYDNGAPQEEISGATSETITYAVPAGTHTLRWAYEKDVSISALDDQGWVDEIRFNNTNEGLDNFDYVWIQDALYPWNLQETSQPGVPTGDWVSGGNVQFDQFAEMSTTIQGPALVQFTMVQTAPGGTLRANYRNSNNVTSTVFHRTGNAFGRYSVLLEDDTYNFEFSWRNNFNEPGSGYVDEFVVTPVSAGGSLADSVELSSGTLAPDRDRAAWIPDNTNFAPAGSGADSSAIRTVAVNTSQFPNSTNNAAIDYTITGPALLSFWWQNSGTPSSSFQFQKVLNPGLSVDASPSQSGPRKLNSLPGGTGWQQVHFEVPPGTHIYRWFYSANSTTESEAGAWLDQITVQPGLMHPSRGIDHWTTKLAFYGDAPWFGISDDSHVSDIPGQDGIDSTTHGGLSNNESTTLTATVVGPKKLHFSWKVSSEFDYDFFTFTLDGRQVIEPISGTVDWTGHWIDIPEGNHVLRWTYSKDESVSNGSDQGWLDSVALLRPDFGLNLVRSGSLLIAQIKKGATGGYFLDSSSDLMNWSPVATPGLTDPRNMLLPNITNSSLVLNSIGNPRQFYRLRFEPEYRHTVENHSFEATGPLLIGDAIQSFPGWEPTDDAFDTALRNYSDLPTNSGTNYLEIKNGFFQRMTSMQNGLRGIHSATAAVGHRPQALSPGNETTLTLRASTVDVGTVVFDASTIPVGTFSDLPQISWDDFQGGATIYSPLDIELRANRSGSSFFDNVRLVTEYE